MTDDEIRELAALLAISAAWPTDRPMINGATEEANAGYFAANRARTQLLQSVPSLLAFIAAQQERIVELTGERDRFERNRDMWKGQCERQAERLRFAHDVIRPFSLDLRPEVPDDQLIDTVAWTAAEHRAAKSFTEGSRRDG